MNDCVRDGVGRRGEVKGSSKGASASASASAYLCVHVRDQSISRYQDIGVQSAALQRLCVSAQRTHKRKQTHGRKITIRWMGMIDCSLHMFTVQYFNAALHEYKQ